MRICYIYGIFNPREQEFFYVGSTVNPGARLKEHTTGSSTSPLVKGTIDELILEGFEPELRILAEVPDAERRKHEGYWIDYYRQHGHRLVNRNSVWSKDEGIVNIGASIYEHQLEAIEKKAQELGVARAVLIRSMFDFALKNMFK